MKNSIKFKSEYLLFVFDGENIAICKGRVVGVFPYETASEKWRYILETPRGYQYRFASQLFESMDEIAEHLPDMLIC